LRDSFVTNAIRIGNQTSVSCADRMEPFEFALHNGFDAFEWFEDKKINPGGSVAGWDESDMDGAARAWIRDMGKARGMRFTVHAPWQANPLHPDGARCLLRSIDFARDIGADLVNLHLTMEEGAASFARSLEPINQHALAAGLRVSIENTPHTTAGDFNQTFAHLDPETIGMCLDIGHANLCAETHNDYVRYMDLLEPSLPIIHLHVHENHGDADSHLTLFTGPARDNDSGVRAFLKRLRRRDYRGAMILEQWPHPPDLLVQATTRLRDLLAAVNGDPCE
jgi:sugar phosphate isomerase/epimerase